MLFYKYKRSFLIIEILLGFFLLAIFLSILQSAPKKAIEPIIEKLLSIELSHRADLQYVHRIKTLSLQDLPKKKGEIFSLENGSETIRIPFFVEAVTAQDFEIRLEEIKTEDTKKTFFYSFIIHSNIKLKHKNIEKTFRYPIIYKSLL
jgi:hypothetical protein